MAQESCRKSQGSNSPTSNYNAGSLASPGRNMGLNHGPGSADNLETKKFQ